MTFAREPRVSPLRYRLVTTGLVGLVLVASHAALPAGPDRARAQYALVLTLGYGHLLGAALGTRRGDRSRLANAFGLTTIALLFVLYAAVVAGRPALALPLLALSAWHTTENDLAIAHALRSRTRLGRLPRDGRTQGVALAVALAVSAAAIAASRDEGALGDVFSAATLFHLLGWLVFRMARGASIARLLAVHALPAALGIGALALPGAAAASLREWLFSPAIYLFFATLHVVHTTFTRERALA